MLANLDEKQIRKAAILLGIPADFLRKDCFVTKAIQTLTQVANEYFSLVFQGGTSLSKGYQIINRLSEDIDFRVIPKSGAKNLGKDRRRKHLRHFRHALVKSLINAGFRVPKETVNIFYEGRFMRIKAEFTGAEKLAYLRPHILIECFAGKLALTPKTLALTSLVKQVLQDEDSDSTFSCTCLALDETAAEKWVALTRRVANTREKQRQSDKHLVRHLYDLYHLHNKQLLTGQYRSIVSAIMKKDREMFNKHRFADGDNPIQEAETALNLLSKNKQWQLHWDSFLEQMVYEKNKPTFQQALDTLDCLSQNIFAEINANTCSVAS